MDAAWWWLRFGVLALMLAAVGLGTWVVVGWLLVSLDRLGVLIGELE